MEELPLKTSSRSKLVAGSLKWILGVLMAALCISCGSQPQDGRAVEPTPTAGAAASPIPWATIEAPTQVGIPAGTPKAQQRSPVRTHSGTGVIRSVNLNEGWFEIEHEEIEGYMPAMRMQWSVRDRSVLKSVQPGDKVDFKLEEDNGSEIITELKKAPATR
jgi:Cu/Ag efflux protein CusF